MASLWASRSSLSPSTSMISTVAQSRGSPQWMDCSTAWITSWSIISRVAGTMPAATMADTVSLPRSMLS